MAGVESFAHRFEPSREGGGRASRTLLLLHGTGGDENDLVPLGRLLDPRAALLSPRGKVLENGMPRFFRRIREGLFDQEDVRRRAVELADFVRGAREVYLFGPVTAVGFSNGANIAAAMLLLEPGVLAGAALFSPMVPIEPQRLPDLGAVPILIAAGRTDPVAPPAEAERLAAILERAGAEVTLQWHPGGHGISPQAVAAARGWLEGAAGAAEP